MWWVGGFVCPQLYPWYKGQWRSMRQHGQEIRATARMWLSPSQTGLCQSWEPLPIFLCSGLYSEENAFPQLWLNPGYSFSETGGNGGPTGGLQKGEAGVFLPFTLGHLYQEVAAGPAALSEQHLPPSCQAGLLPFQLPPHPAPGIGPHCLRGSSSPGGTAASRQSSAPPLTSLPLPPPRSWVPCLSFPLFKIPREASFLDGPLAGMAKKCENQQAGDRTRQNVLCGGSINWQNSV